MKRIIILACVVFLTACITSHPQNARDFRAAVPGAFMAKVEKYEVSQPYSKVAARFKKMAPKCLNVSVETVSQTNMSYQVIVTDYKATVVPGKTRTELHVQQHHAKGVMNVTKEPEGGYYLMVFDAIKAGKNKTRIEYYGPSSGHEAMVDAIKSWASGEGVSCPDLTK
ncbi:hypothetical protein ACFL3P_00820 [Pseudomonadota bacterium]